MSESYPYNILYNYLTSHNEFGIKEEEIKEAFLSSSNADSSILLSIKRAFATLKIPIEFYKVKYVDLKHLTYPFLAYLGFADRVVLVLKSSDVLISYLSEDGIVKEHASIFEKRWSGVVSRLTNERGSSDETLSSGYTSPVLKYKKLLLLLTLFFSISFFYQLLSPPGYKGTFLLSLLISIVGTVVSLIITAETIKIKAFSNNLVCKSNSKISCESILISKASFFFNLFSWSDVGVTYFIGLFIYETAMSGNPDILKPISVISILSIGYVIYSLSYQLIIAKRWCALCLVIQFLLIFQFVLVYKYFSFDEILSFKTSIYILIPFLISSIAWTLFKPYYKELVTYPELSRNLISLKYSPKAFNSIIRSQRQLVEVDCNNPIVFGNQDSKNVIHLIISPFCLYCARTFISLIRYLDEKKDVFHFIVVFKLKAEDKSSARIASALINYYFHSKQEDVINIWLDWFTSLPMKNEVKWLKKKSFSLQNSESVNAVLKCHVDFCEQNDIKNTPAKYCNHYLFAPQYDIKDIIKFMDFDFFEK
ncbi:vitamin K epoxide reductase family protein [Parafilimonas sp.]|uniref:vitamin K epoxide reductase family protein n=1 Tax=Parafilimonas sp. TaxID=1969739 RepID=UPI0039E331C6